jgi:hypothetical protein
MLSMRIPPFLRTVPTTLLLPAQATSRVLPCLNYRRNNSLSDPTGNKQCWGSGLDPDSFGGQRIRIGNPGPGRSKFASPKQEKMKILF